MKKSELIAEMAKRGKLSKEESTLLVETFFDEIAEALESGNRVEIRGFGSFSTRQKEARRGRNPKTGEEIEISAKRFPHFKPGKDLREHCSREDEYTEGGDSYALAAK